MVLEQLIFIFNSIFSPLIVLKPHISLLIISVILTIIIVVLNRLTIKRELLREVKNRVEQIRENLAKAQKEGDSENAKRFLQDMMKANNDYMRQIFKGTIVSAAVVFLFFPWLQHTYEVTYKGIPVAQLPFAIPFIGTNLNWLAWYILVSIAIGWILRKFFGLD